MLKQNHSFLLLFLLLFASLLLTTGCQQRSTSPTSSPVTGAGGTTGKKPPPPGGPIMDASVPIKVCCGAMTFYATQAWVPATGKPNTFCTSLPAGVTYSVAVNDQTPSDEAAQAETMPASFASLTGDWNIKIRSYVPGSGGRKISREGAQIQPDKGGLCPQVNGRSEITLSPLHEKNPVKGKVGFYPDPGPPSPNWKYNRRFYDDAGYSDYDCSRDRDMCERIASVSVGTQTARCTKPDCSVFIKRD